MGKMSKRERVLIWIASIALISFLYYSFVLSSAITKIKASITKTSGYKQSIKNENDKNEVIAKLKIEKEEIKADYLNAVIALPSLEKNPEIINRIKTLAIKNGIDISAVSISEPEPIVAEGEGSDTDKSDTSTGRMMRVGVQVSLKMADYAKAKAFLADVENEKRFAEIISININVEENNISQSVGTNYYYVDSENKETPVYDFSIAPGGKPNLFK